MKHILHLIIFILSTPLLHGQDSVAIYGWKDHYTYRTFAQVTASPTALYTTSEIGLVKWKLPEMEAIPLTKVDGLSDVQPLFVQYFNNSKALFVVYKNANIDIIYKDRIQNNPSILLNNILLGKKSIYDFAAVQGGMKNEIWLAGQFGITSIDIETGLTKENILTKNPIIAIDVQDAYHVAATASGVYQFIGSNNPLIADFGRWTNISTQLPDSTGVSDVDYFNKHLYLNINNTIYRKPLESNVFEVIMTIGEKFQFNGFYEVGDEFYIAALDKDNYDYNTLYQVTEDLGALRIDTLQYGCTFGLTDIEKVGNDYFFGNNRGSLLQLQDKIECITYEINSPAFKYVHDLQLINDKLFITTGGVTLEFYPINTYSTAGYNVYDGEKWEIFDFSKKYLGYDVQFINVLQTLPIPESQDYYISSYYKGIMRYSPDSDEYTIYDEMNSCLSTVPGTEETRVTGMALDKNNTLWVTNFLGERGLSRINDDGTCEVINHPSISTQLGELIVDREGNIWATDLSGGNGIMVYDPVNNRVQNINESNSNLKDNNVRALAVDKNGIVWVGSSSGITNFTCGSQIFEQICASVPTIDIENDSIPDPLLNDQSINCISIDGGNRKWFGTINGLLVQSANSNTNVFTFNTKNSPLPSNNITDIEINNKNGTVYIATDLGICSFKNDAINAKDYHTSEIITYPNPVRPTYDGPIVIKGLANNSTVKITDQRGFLVAELFSRGGLATWNGKDANGNRVATGVYLVFSSGQLDDAGETTSRVGKILFIR